MASNEARGPKATQTGARLEGGMARSFLVSVETHAPGVRILITSLIPSLLPLSLWCVCPFPKLYYVFISLSCDCWVNGWINVLRIGNEKCFMWSGVVRNVALHVHE